MDGLHHDDAPQARFPFDPIYKALCCHRQTVADMLRGYLAEPAGPLGRDLVDALDLGTLSKLSMEWVTREFRLRRGDQVWRVAFTPAARKRGYPAFMLVNLEFQSRRDGYMALRFLEQGAELYRELRAHGALEEGDPCPVLCILLHNGRSPWTAATAAAELVPLPAALGCVPETPPGMIAFYPWGYFPIDFVAHRATPHVPGSVVSMMIGIEFARGRGDLVGPLWDTARNLEDEELRDTVARWLRRLDEKYNLNLPGLEDLLEMEDKTVLTSRLDETLEGWRRDARADGLEQGLVQQRAMLARQTALRFGAEVADRVAALLEGVGNPERLTAAGELIVSAETGTELTERLAESA